MERAWYPVQSEHINYEQWNAHRQTLDLVYSLRDQLEELKGKHAELHGKHEDLKKENAKLQETINNRIAGKLVKAGALPSTGDTIRYNSATGQFEFGV